MPERSPQGLEPMRREKRIRNDSWVGASTEGSAPPRALYGLPIHGGWLAALSQALARTKSRSVNHPGKGGARETKGREMKTRDREDRLSKQINAICLELTAADEDEIADRIVFDHLWLVMIRDYPDLETAEELASLMADGADATE